MPIRLTGKAKFTSGPSQPVTTAGGTMPGGSEMLHWYNHIPFPNPEVLAAKREVLLAEIEARNAKKAATEAAQVAIRRIGRVTTGTVTERKRAA